MRAHVRLLVAVAAVVALGVAVLVWRSATDEGPSTSSGDASGDQAVASCLGETLRDDVDGPCRALRDELDELDPERVDVLVVVPDSVGAERTVDLVTSAVETWSEGRAAAAESTGDSTAPVQVRADVVDTAGATHPLIDPEVVFVAADPRLADQEVGDLKDLAVYGPSGDRCAVFEDVFAVSSWSSRPGFASHHRLPEGTYVQDCGSRGGQVCFAINATLDGSAVGVDPFEAYTLVTDELSHCLQRSTVG